MNKFKKLLLVLTSLTSLAYAPPKEQLTRRRIRGTLTGSDLVALRTILREHSGPLFFDMRPLILRQTLAWGNLEQLRVVFEEGTSPSKEIRYDNKNFGTPLMILTVHQMNLDPGQDGFLAKLRYLEYKRRMIREAIDRE